MENYYEKIGDYLDGVMDEPARQLFEAQLQTDEALAKQLALTRDVRQHFQQKALGQEQEASVQNTLTDLGSLYFSKEETAMESKNGEDQKETGKVVNMPKPTGRIRFAWWQIAAAIALILGIVWLLKPASNPADLYARFRKFPEASFTQMGEPQQSGLPQAAAAFNKKDYAAALKIFEDYLSNNPDNKEVQFFAALCLLETGREDDAEAVFASLMSPKNALTEEAQWYEVLYHLKKGNKPMAVALLDLIKIQAGHSHQADAQKLWNTLTK